MKLHSVLCWKEGKYILAYNVRSDKPRFPSPSYSTTVYQYLTDSYSTLFFDYIIALYPILMTILVYALIELYDHNCKIIYLSYPFKKPLLQWKVEPKALGAIKAWVSALTLLICVIKITYNL